MHDLILIYAQIFFAILGIVCSYFIHKGSVEYFFEPYPGLLLISIKLLFTYSICSSLGCPVLCHRNYTSDTISAMHCQEVYCQLWLVQDCSCTVRLASFFVSIVCLGGSILMYVLMFLRLSSPLTSVIQESLGRKVHSLSCNSTWSWEIWCGPTKVESCLSPSRDPGTSARFPPGVCVMRKKQTPIFYAALLLRLCLWFMYKWRIKT